MNRFAWILAALILLGCAAIAGYTLTTDDAEAPKTADVPAVQIGPDAATEPPSPPAPETAAPAQSVSPATVANWVAAVSADDPEKRAEAISSLANASKADAIPVLRTVLKSGESAIDRPLALRSLRALALRDGDADGAIRDVLREAVYHGDNEDFTRAAQTALDDVEGMLVQR